MFLRKIIHKIKNHINHVKELRGKKERRIFFLGMRTALAVIILAMITTSVIFVTNTFAAGTVTPGSGGTNISADTASNATSPAYTTLGIIRIGEIGTTGFVNNASGTIILTPPTNRQFRPGTGGIFEPGPDDLDSFSMSVLSTGIIISYHVSGTINNDRLSLSGIQVRPITGNLLPSSGNITVSCANPGTASTGIDFITCGVTNFGSLSMVTGAINKLLITLPGQTFSMGTGNIGSPTTQTGGTSFVISAIRATDQFFNVVTSYTGAKTISYSGPTGVTSFITGVTFLTGVSSTTLTTTIYSPQTTTITAADGTTTGPASSSLTINGSSDLSLTKTANTGTALSGTIIVYTIIYTNNGPSNITGITVTDIFPSEFTFSSASAGIYSGGNHTLTVTGITLNANTSGTLIITGVGNSTIASGVVFVNTGGVSSTYFDSNTANNTGTVSITGAVTPPSANLNITKSANKTGNVIAGELITYTIIYGNSGTDTATGLVIQDVLSGITFVSSSPTLILSGSSYRLTGINLPSGSGGTIIITGTVTTGYASGTSLTNTVFISSTTTDPDSANNSGSVSATYITNANLSITKTSSTGFVMSGDILSFTLNFSNAGPDTGNSITITDFLPSEITFVSASTGTYSGGNHTLTLTGLTLAPGATGTIIITGQGNSTIVNNTLFTNTGTISSNVEDPNTANNTSTVSLTGISIASANLNITKNADTTGTVLAGQIITYTITYANSGPNTATGLVIEDILSGITFVSSSPTLILSGSSYRLTGINLPNGSGGTIIITGSATTGFASGTTLTNTVTISSDVNDPNTANNSGSAENIVVDPAANMNITKTASTGFILSGNLVSFTITYSNTGPQTASGIIITDTLPNEITFLTSSLAPSISGQVLTWTGLTLLPNTTGTIVITGQGNSGIINNTVITNTVSITGTTLDPNTGNNTASVSLTGITNDIANLNISKTVNTGSIIAGGTLVYTISYFNSGPNTATGLVIEDILSGVTFVSSSPTLVLSGSSYRLTGINLPSGSGGTIIITGTVQTLSSGTIVTNTATISSDINDPNTANNTSSANSTVFIAYANLNVSKTVDKTSVLTGETITYTIIYNNAGAYIATATALDDTLSTNLTFLSSFPAYTNVIGNIYTWNLGDLPSGSGGSIYLTAMVLTGLSTGTLITNVANITSTTFDPDNSNNSGSATSTVTELMTVDLTVSKIVSSSVGATGDTIVYTINYSNVGGSTASGITIEDIFPPQLTFVSSSPSLTLSGSTYVLSGLTLPPLATGTIIITGFITNALSSGTMITNTITISSADFDVNTGNNNSSTNTIYVPRSDTSIIKTEDKTSLSQNETITYTLSYLNSGPDTAGTLTVTDMLPSGLNIISTDPSPSSISGNTYIWNFSTIAPGTTGIIVITGTIPCDMISGTILTNTGLITSTNSDPDTANNRSVVYATITGNGCPATGTNLSISMNTNNGTATNNQEVNYSIAYANNGPNIATSAIIQNTLPSELSFSTSSPIFSSQLGNVYTRNLGNLPVGATGSISLTAVVLGSVANNTIITNSATISSSTAETSSADNTATANTTVIGTGVPPVVTPETNGGGGGGGGRWFKTDVENKQCPDGIDYTNSYYDNDCGRPPQPGEETLSKEELKRQLLADGIQQLCSDRIIRNDDIIPLTKMDPELIEAHQFAYRYGLTIFKRTRDFELLAPLKMKDLSSMLQMFLRVLCIDPQATPTVNDKTPVSKAQIITALIQIITKKPIDLKSEYRRDYYEFAKFMGITKETSIWKIQKAITREEVIIIFHRIYKLLSSITK